MMRLPAVVVGLTMLLGSGCSKKSGPTEPATPTRPEKKEPAAANRPADPSVEPWDQKLADKVGSDINAVRRRMPGAKDTVLGKRVEFRGTVVGFDETTGGALIECRTGKTRTTARCDAITVKKVKEGDEVAVKGVVFVIAPRSSVMDLDILLTQEELVPP